MRKHNGRWLALGLAAALILSTTGVALAQKADRKPAEMFPAADPESVGIPAKALELLADHIQGLVDGEEIVGGELLVIKNRLTVFREAYGWQDREAEKALQTDAVYCVRSMTKPLVGTAIQMLIDEGRLRPDMLVSELLPFFDGPQTGKITVEHLLTHTGGFPFTTLGKPLTEYPDLSAVAAEAVQVELLFEPGARFEYSDAGSDTLGAIVEKLTGMAADKFVQKRILDPLGMQDSVTLLARKEATLARIPSAYSGGTGAWTKHWDPSDSPIFPLFLTSQSLYSTTTDYARFLALWMDDGQVGGQRLLSSEAVARGLEPVQKMTNYPPIMKGVNVYYGRQWMVYAKSSETEAQTVVAFGHGGSDGTHAWAWPELDLMVLFFTQSRGTTAGLGLEPLLHTVLVDQRLDDPSLLTHVPTEEELAQIAGLYWDETNAHAYYVIQSEGDRVTLDRPGRAHLVFKATATPGRYVHELNSNVWIEFLRGDDGTVNAMRTSFGGNVETDPRHVPAKGLPSAAEVVASVQKAHHVDRLAELGAVRMSGTLKIEARQIEGPLTRIFDATRERTELAAGPVEQVSLVDNDRVWSYTTVSGTDELDGQLREQALLERAHVRFGDWTEHYEQVEVLKRVEFAGKQVLMVRVVSSELPGATMFVDEASGQVMRTDTLTLLPGVGLVGVRTLYRDFRDVGGMLLPFQSVAHYATPLIGRVVTTVDSAETGVEVTNETFTVPAAKEDDAG